jgi:multisubunit Na+/H+ antiporter MnhF subunit
VIAATYAVLLVAGALFAFRALRGPSIVDRVIAIDGLLVVGMITIAAESARTGSGVYLPVLLILTLVGFISTAIVARYIESRSSS